MSDTVTFSHLHILILLNLLNIRINGAPAWVVRGLEPDATVDLEQLEQLRRRLQIPFRAAKGADLETATVDVAIEPGEILEMLEAVAPLMQEDRLQESECHALTGGHWAEAVDLLAWMTTVSAGGDRAD